MRKKHQFRRHAIAGSGDKVLCLDAVDSFVEVDFGAHHGTEIENGIGPGRGIEHLARGDRVNL